MKIIEENKAEKFHKEKNAESMATPEGVGEQIPNERPNLSPLV